MVTLKQCVESAGLKVGELVLDIAPSARHRALLQSYLLNLHRGREAVLRMIVCDLRGYLDLGAQRFAADLLVVLRLFLSEQRDIACAPRRQAAAQRAVGFDQALSRQRRVPRRARRERAKTSLNPALQ